MSVACTIASIVDKLKLVNGISALVLGGSRARGTDNIHSDIDIGIYYDSSLGLDIAQLRQVAAELDDDHREDLVTEIGGWGPWINGGGWLKVNQIAVDFIYRDQHKVSRVMDECVRGEVRMDYQPGHPHGFANAIYMAEISLCQVLWDPSDVIGNMKSRTIPYPRAFLEAIIGKFLWEATFALDNGYKGIYKNDISFIAGCCFRSVSCLNQVLFAKNETYLMNEKGAAAIADSFQIVPIQYAQRINDAFALITEDPDSLREAINKLRELVQETKNLING
ncbi:nucleotidyltransferase domain-containing protein [Paenibacillus qinlingensis]|uniref:Nucleotidyltransferase n=1 Tax=Paenibacillus qinlingensis TaxID=1837343 RepID=A0ABU1NRZ5_9BACL|nr:nucleotidyltransferase domain-containing protein [Paenibacillus qinlingensis]MDR6550129.1 putative nucleotidyltransferase [Paenibacillus qinlingensis]